MRYLLFLFLIVVCKLCWSQKNNTDQLKLQLETLSVDFPALDETAEVRVHGVDIHRFVQSLGATHDLNLDVEKDVKAEVSYYFNEVAVADVILYLCQQFNLSVEVTGSIITLKRVPEVVVEKPKWVPKKIDITYVDSVSRISFNLTKDTLIRVLKAISEVTGANVAVAEKYQDKVVNLLVKDEDLEKAIRKIGFVTDLELVETEEYGYFYDKRKEEINPNKLDKNRFGNRTLGVSQNTGVWFQEETEGRFSIATGKANLNELLSFVSEKMNAKYILYSEVKGESSFFLEDITFQEFLDLVLDNTLYDYQIVEGVYVIGETKDRRFIQSELIRLENRTIDNVKKLLPKTVSSEIEIIEFPDLNGFVVSGTPHNVQLVKDVLKEIDQVVPVINIEVLIVDINKSRSTSAGIQAGFGGENVPESSSGILSPGLDFTFNSNSVNRLINSFNGLGIINLGKVTPNFYLSLSAAESDGLLKTKSTPKLATLNGNEATLKIGRTEYYLEVQNNIIGSQNPSLSASQNYKSVSADLSVTIKPIASSDNQVTMTVQVSQSDFTERISETAPPGTINRTFQSTIRVKDGEMVVLGGLEDVSTERTGSGIPFLNRIPVLRWFFGYRESRRSKAKLNIFIKPTIHY